ncbi:hypothetical protein GCM10020366_01580 [Saccharopolyspora gregorii]|uniref:Uncharacterized protein n=1 Tax=Saccharopolyspora gregorii TaxID=33914 RepID=A0ABP6RKV8_9PSEU
MIPLHRTTAADHVEHTRDQPHWSEIDFEALEDDSDEIDEISYFEGEETPPPNDSPRHRHTTACPGFPAVKGDVPCST